MNVDVLLSKLANLDLEIAKEVHQNPKETHYQIHRVLKFFPLRRRHPVWFTLVVEDGQTEIPREEAEALLRHFWLGSEDLGKL